MKNPDRRQQPSSGKGQRRALRRSSPPAEKILWARLRNRQLLHCKFRRQHSFGRYVVDFYCKEYGLAIELDGDSHFIGDAEARDQTRQIDIERYGVTFLRFTNPEVFDNIDGVLVDIEQFILDRRDNAGDATDTSETRTPSP